MGNYRTLLLVPIALNVAALGGLAGQEPLQPQGSGTAYVLSPGNWEKGLFQPLRFGLRGGREVSVNPLIATVVPHARLKVQRSAVGGWQRAYRYSFAVPTPLMRLFRRSGTGGLFAPDPSIAPIPWMVMVRQEVLLTRPWRKGTMTGKLGVALALRGGELDSRYLLELPVIYPRLAVYFQGWQVNLGLDGQYPLSRRWSVLADTDLLITPGYKDPWAWEQKGMLQWRKSGRFRIDLGYKLVIGKYPTGQEWQILPLADLIWSRSKRGGT